MAATLPVLVGGLGLERTRGLTNTGVLGRSLSYSLPLEDHVPRRALDTLSVRYRFWRIWEKRRIYAASRARTHFPGRRDVSNIRAFGLLGRA